MTDSHPATQPHHRSIYRTYYVVRVKPMLTERTDQAWFSCLLQQLARKWSDSIITTRSPHGTITFSSQVEQTATESDNCSVPSTTAYVLMIMRCGVQPFSRLITVNTSLGSINDDSNPRLMYAISTSDNTCGHR